MNRTSFLCGNRNGHHYTQNVKTHNRTTQKTKNMSNTDPIKKPGVNSCAREEYVYCLYVRIIPAASTRYSRAYVF